ncbi:hypothetical protein ACTFIR_009354 [Dictyostelium discoideum]
MVTYFLSMSKSKKIDELIVWFSKIVRPSDNFKLNLKNSVLQPTQSIECLGLKIDSVLMKLLDPQRKKKSFIKEIRNFLKLDCCSQRKFSGLKGKLIALKDAVIPFGLLTRRTNKLLSLCLTLANGDLVRSLPFPQDVKSAISHWLTVLKKVSQADGSNCTNLYSGYLPETHNLLDGGEDIKEQVTRSDQWRIASSTEFHDAIFTNEINVQCLRNT